MKALEIIGTWALLTVFGIIGAYFFVKAWDATAPEWERQNFSVVERDFKPFFNDFAGGRQKTTGFGFYERKRGRGR